MDRSSIGLLLVGHQVYFQVFFINKYFLCYPIQIRLFTSLFMSTSFVSLRCNYVTVFVLLVYVVGPDLQVSGENMYEKIFVVRLF